MSTLAQRLRAHATRRPTAPFLRFEGAAGETATWSYGAFDAAVDAVAAGLRDAGLQRGDAFLVRLRNHPALVASILAASRTGTVAVPVDPALQVRELAHCAELARCCLVVEHAGEERAEALELPSWSVEPAVATTWFGAPPRCAPIRAQAPDGVVELLFTSGTTSRPKAVMLTEGAIAHGAATLASAAGYGGADVPLVTLTLFHAAAQMHQLWPTLALGGCAALLERFSASRFFAQAARHGATTSAQFAASLRMLLARGERVSSGLRHITFAQRLGDEEYAGWDERFGVRLQHLWGMTETVGLPVMSPLSGDRRLAAMGRPVPGYTVDVRAPEDGRPVADETPGELVVRAAPGRTVALGYFRDAAATDALLRDGWLWSGDIVRRDADGFLHFVGRHADIIRRAGVNFSALEVEEVLRTFPGVRDAAVVALPDAVRDERVAAALVADERIDEAALRAHCDGALAAYKRPECFHLVAELPRTSVGKVRKHELAAQLAALDEAPRT